MLIALVVGGGPGCHGCAGSSSGLLTIVCISAAAVAHAKSHIGGWCLRRGASIALQEWWRRAVRRRGFGRWAMMHGGWRRRRCAAMVMHHCHRWGKLLREHGGFGLMWDLDEPSSVLFGKGWRTAV